MSAGRLNDATRARLGSPIGPSTTFRAWRSTTNHAPGPRPGNCCASTEMRKRVQAHVLRLPVSYFDSTKTGVVISRIMTDAEGVRNLVGTGLIQLLGSILTALMAVGILFYVNWKLTTATVIALGAF